MKNPFGQFDEVSYVAFMEAATEYYNFQTCQRADGSYYGTGGQCRKGTPAEKPEKEEKKGKGGGGGTPDKYDNALEGIAMRNGVNPYVGGGEDMLDHLIEDKLNNGKDAWVSQYDKAKTNSERDRIAGRAQAEMDNDYYVDKKVLSSQKKAQSSIEKAMKQLNDDDGEALQEVATRVLMDAGIKDPRDGEIERLAMSWTGDL